MTDQDNSYRPRSPDFSNLASVPSSSFSDAYSPSPYTSTGPFTPQASYDASPFFNPHLQQQQQPQPQQPQQHQQQHHTQQPPYQPQRQHYPHHQYPTQPYIPQPYSPVSEMPPQTRSRTQHAQQSQAQPPFSRHPSSHEHYPQYQPPELPHEQQPPHHRQQQEPEQHQHHEPQPPYPEAQQPAQPLPEEASPDEKIPIAAVSSSGPSAGIEVRTKFPVARIKRIMQADEDVGKVAQVTPIAVSKALELFMISLVTKAAQQAKDRSSKRITAAHLKEAIAKDEVLDFLADIISKIPDQAHRKQDDDNSDQNEAPKKKGGRRKKEEPDDDF